MVRITGVFILVMVLSSCSQKDSQFCECMEAGKELNEFAQTLWEKNVTKADADKQKQLKEAQTEACKNYQTMDGTEMLKRKEACED
jgi:hypothetical protein